MASEAPRANTEFGALTRIGLTTGAEEMARLIIGRALHHHALGQLVIHQRLQRHRIQEIDHLAVQRSPQLVGHAAVAFAQAVFLAAALGGVDRFVHRDDDVGHGDVGGLATQRVTAAWAAGGLDQLMAAQLAKQLLQIGERNLLALADGRQRDGAIVLAQGQIDHGGDRKAAFGGEAHVQAP